MTGYVQRTTCNCGCVSNNCFWQDGGTGGTNHLSHLHNGIGRFLDELSGAGPGGTGKGCDVKVTVTIEKLEAHDHRIVNRRSFSGLGYSDNMELKEAILQESIPTDTAPLAGADEYSITAPVDVALNIDYLQDMHDKLLLVRRTGNVAKLDQLMQSLSQLIGKQ